MDNPPTQAEHTGDVSDSASICFLLPPPSEDGATSGRSVSPRQNDLPPSSPAGSPFSKPVAALPPNTMQPPLESVSPRFFQPALLASMKFPEEKPVQARFFLPLVGKHCIITTCWKRNCLQAPVSTSYKICFLCVTSLLLCAALVTGGLAIALKKRRNEVDNPVAVSAVCVGAEGCGEEVLSLEDVIKQDDVQGGGANVSPSAPEPFDGYVKVPDIVEDQPEEKPALTFSIDSYLSGSDFSNRLQAIRQQGFGINVTSSLPLLQQPQATAVSSNLFKYNYVEAWFKSLLMFEVQRGGTQVFDTRTWRLNDSTAFDEAIVGDTAYSMDGGWFEAGNHLKITIPTGFTLTRLAWMCEYYRPTLSSLMFEEGGTTSFGSAGAKENEELFGGKSAYEWCKREVHWGASWLRKAALISSDGTLEGIVVQCGLSKIDHSNVINAERIQGGPKMRPCIVANETHPATADAAQLAAGLAAASRMFSTGTADEVSMADDWMMVAKKVLEFARTNAGDKVTWFQKVEEDLLYPTTMLDDHMFFAEASMFLTNVATGNLPTAMTYFEAAMKTFNSSTSLQYRCTVTLSNWDAPCSLAMLMMVQGSADYTSWFSIQLATQFLDPYIGKEDPNRGRTVGKGDITITPKGARFFDGGPSDEPLWGSLRSLGEAASIAALVADFPGIQSALQMRFRCLTASQVNYILGDTGQSFVIGIGNNYPKSPHHRDSFCALRWDVSKCTYKRWGNPRIINEQIVVGAMVGGPDARDRFEDSREEYQASEIAIDFQVAYISALTGALTMPDSFWHEGRISELETACDAVGLNYPSWIGSEL